MPDLIQAATTWLAAQLKQNAAQPVTLTRGSQSTPNIQAVIGQTTFEADNGAGVIDRWESRDFLIDAADYQLGGVVVLPLRHDRFTQVIGGVTVTYEAAAPRDMAVYQYADGYRTKLRVHTKQLS